MSYEAELMRMAFERENREQEEKENHLTNTIYEKMLEDEEIQKAVNKIHRGTKE